ncbi:unnamed protein product [Cyprideis torosa]|uniref:Uncharacterized protein n=1 Tax=Cyprideis torosa TaxID=163714 RepID=A0A7R8W651_9CRUS|nr:unnamed protein product [Cyprideis torosa]CAG0883640.1 unnamed protein product [Cyprideis torosa]
MPSFTSVESALEFLKKNSTSLAAWRCLEDLQALLSINDPPMEVDRPLAKAPSKPKPKEVQWEFSYGCVDPPSRPTDGSERDWREARVAQLRSEQEVWETWKSPDDVLLAQQKALGDMKQLLMKVNEDRTHLKKAEVLEAMTSFFFAAKHLNRASQLRKKVSRDRRDFARLKMEKTEQRILDHALAELTYLQGRESAIKTGVYIPESDIPPGILPMDAFLKIAPEDIRQLMATASPEDPRVQLSRVKTEIHQLTQMTEGVVEAEGGLANVEREKADLSTRIDRLGPVTLNLLEAGEALASQLNLSESELAAEESELEDLAARLPQPLFNLYLSALESRKISGLSLRVKAEGSSAETDLYAEAIEGSRSLLVKEWVKRSSSMANQLQGSGRKRRGSYCTFPPRNDGTRTPKVEDPDVTHAVGSPEEWTHILNKPLKEIQALVTQVHPLSVLIQLIDSSLDPSEVSLRFSYVEGLELAFVSTEISSKPHPTFLQALLPRDDARVSPNPSTVFILKRFQPKISFEELQESLNIGKAYHWVQRVCGRRFPCRSVEGLDQMESISEVLSHCRQRLSVVADLKQLLRTKTVDIGGGFTLSKFQESQPNWTSRKEQEFQSAQACVEGELRSTVVQSVVIRFVLLIHGNHPLKRPSCFISVQKLDSAQTKKLQRSIRASLGALPEGGTSLLDCLQAMAKEANSFVESELNEDPQEQEEPTPRKRPRRRR